jgi:putative ABC transport system permease protein
MGTLFGDIHFAVRIIRKAPAFALVAIATMALGIGATTAVFSVVDGILLKPLPVKDQADLLVVWTSKPEPGFSHWPLSYASYLGIRERVRTVSGLAAQPYAGALPVLVNLDDGSAIPLQQAVVTGEWFEVLGVRARAGRLLAPIDDQVGSPRVVVLSSDAARRLFGNVGDAVGRRIRLQQTAFTVVGVTPAEFDYPRHADAWVPAVWSRDSPYVAWDLLARIAPGFTKEQTAAALSAALHTLPKQTGPLGAIESSQRIEVQSFTDNIVGDTRPALLMLCGGVLLVLMVAGFNVANLLITRGLGRRRELSLREAMGADRMRLLRQLTTEAMVLATFATGLGLFVAFIVLDFLLVLAPPELPRLGGITIDERALVFAVIVAVVVAIVFGAVPAFQASHADPAEVLRAPESTGDGRTGRYWFRHALVVGQIGTTMLVLSTAVLLLRSFDRLRLLDAGFNVQDLYLAEVSISPARYTEPADLQRAMIRLARLTAAVPGVTLATAIVTPPFAGTQGVDATVFAEGQRADESASPLVNYEGVDASYFKTLQLPIVRGRGIDERDRAGSEPVVVVNQAFARVFWPGKDPVGRRIKWGKSTSEGPWFSVVGLVGDTRYRELTRVTPTIYVPYAHGIPVSPSYLAVRSGSPAQFAAGLRAAIAVEEPGATVLTVQPLRQLLAAPYAHPRFQATLAGWFAGLALLLSIVGTYTALAFFVRDRRREIGIRMALGAAPSAVRHLILRQGLTMGAVGIVIGTASSLAVGPVIQPLLFGVNSTDSSVLIGTAAALLVTVVVSALVPVAAAARTNPLIVLRGE